MGEFETKQPRKPAILVLKVAGSIFALGLLTYAIQDFTAAREYRSALDNAKAAGLNINPKPVHPEIPDDQNAHVAMSNTDGMTPPYLPVVFPHHIEPFPLSQAASMVDDYKESAKKVDQISHMPFWFRKPDSTSSINGILDNELLREQIDYFSTAAHIEFRRGNLVQCKADFETAARLLNLLGQFTSYGQASYDGSALTSFRNWLALTASESQNNADLLDFIQTLNAKTAKFDLKAALTGQVSQLIDPFVNHPPMTLGDRFGMSSHSFHLPFDERRFLTLVVQRAVKTATLYDDNPHQRGLATRLMDALPTPTRPQIYADALLYGRSFPVFTGLTSAAARDETNQKLLDLGIHILKYKLKRGVLPDSLDQLPGSPDLADPFTGDPLLYKKSGKGFILYSRGSNRIDNGAPQIPMSNDIYFQTADIRKVVMGG